MRAGSVTRSGGWSGGPGTTATGDRAELDFEPHFRAWAMVSTTARECPGAFRCPSGRDCFAEDARARAAEADVVVVNTHLYGAHLASGGAVLPPHEVVVFDEAHEVEEVMTDSLGVEIGPGSVPGPGRRRPSLGGPPDRRIAAVDGVADAGDLLHRVLRPLAGRRILPPRPWSAPRARAGPPVPARPPARRARSGWSSVWTLPRHGPRPVPARPPPRRRPGAGRGHGPGHRTGRPAGRPPAPGRAGGR